MVKLQTLEAHAEPASILAALDAAGAVMIDNVIDPERVQQITREAAPYLARARMGRDEFEGQRTQRTGALVARTPTVRELIMHPTMLGAAREFLAPYIRSHRVAPNPAHSYSPRGGRAVLTPRPSCVGHVFATKY